MAIRQLIDFTNNKNIAADLDKNELMLIADDVVERFNEDLDSMDEWIKGVDFGLKLVKQELHPRSTPWEGASNFKSNLLREASLAFGNRSSLELLRSKNIVKADVIGKDEQGKKQERADRITEVMNYQVNVEMKEWRKQHKAMLYTLPSIGTMFKKTIFDPLLGRNISHIIHYPDFVVNQATTDIDTARSFTHILDISQNKIVENQRAGIWLDTEEDEINPEDSDGDEGSNEKEEVDNACDNPNRYFEQYCFIDLDKDGYEEPYTVTVHEQSRKVVRIVARYDQNSIMVTDDTEEILSLQEAGNKRSIPQQQQAFAAQQQAAILAQSRGIQPTPPTPPTPPDLTGLEVVRIEAAQPITKYGFTPSIDGTFLDLGYFHLIGGITQALNATTNQLIDSGTINNLQGGFLAKGVRKKMGPLKLKMGEFKSTNLEPAQLAQGILQLPTKEPSATLFQLNEKLDNQGRQFTQAVDASGQIQANTAPTTALAIIQEQLIPLSALMGRIIDSMSEEFQKLFKLNQRFLDPEQYQTILDDPQAKLKADFNSDGFDIVPTANAEMSSKMQRIQMAQVQVEQIPMVLGLQGNPLPIGKEFFEAIGSPIADQVFPDENKMSEEERQKLGSLRQQQEQQNQLLQKQNEQLQRQNDLNQRQIEILAQAEERKGREQQVKATEAAANADIKDRDMLIKEAKAPQEIDEIASKEVLNLEKAESEDVKNRSSVYTAEIQEQTKRLSNQGG